MVQCAPDGPDVNLEIIWLLLHEFWRQVQRRADSRSVQSDLTGHDLGHAQIADLDPPVPCQEDVQTLDISVHDVLGVQVLDRHADLVCKVPDVFLREVLASQSLFFQQLHPGKKNRHKLT